MARLFRRRKGNEGFTLIELVIVMAIIAVMGALLLPRISANARAAKQGACKQNMLLAASGVEAYKIEHRDNWPANLSAVKHYVGEDAIKCPDSDTPYVLYQDDQDNDHYKIKCTYHGIAYDLEEGAFETLEQ